MKRFDLKILGPNIIGCLVVMVWAGCNLSEPAQRIEVDPRLNEVTGEMDTTVPDTGSSEDTGTGEDTNITLDADVDETLFTCQPSCQDHQFCAPDKLCYSPQSECTAVLDVCDPLLTPRTPEFICEAVYGTKAGLCRRVCDTSQGNLCESGESCGRFDENSSISICRTSCDIQTECHPLEHCGGGFFSLFKYCRGGCKPFVEDQCGESQMCLAEAPERGFCTVFGELEEFEECSQSNRCTSGMTCLNLGAGQRCRVVCSSESAPGEPGSCEEGDVCQELIESGIGICGQSCDMFDAAQSCEGDLGCTPIDGSRSGSCTLRGGKNEGEDCRSTAECSDNLLCVTDADDSDCRQLCLPNASAGEMGSCPSDHTCALLSSSELGYCQPP